MTRTLWLAFLLGVTAPAFAQSDSRVPFVEQEVRRLQQEILVLTRRIEELERRAPSISSPRASVPAATASLSGTWLDAGKWRRLHAGMSELEVISLLGPPTTMREEAGVRSLFYALEIGSSGYLGGSVKLRNRVVSEILVPSLQ